MPLVISSMAFKDGEYIPARYTADGQNVSPALSWSGVPAKTSSLALVLHDPDATRPGGFTHWVIFNLPPLSQGLPGGVPCGDHLENGAAQGRNDAGAAGYMGPSPHPTNRTTTALCSMHWTSPWYFLPLPAACRCRRPSRGTS